MKSSKHILSGIILVMAIVFMSSVFAQVTPTQPPTQPPILQTFDPNRKLRELQAAEDRKRVSRQQAIKAEITKLVQKDVEIKKTKKVEICTSPKIFSVSSREVNPGDPVYIRGCGFGISKGSVTISHLFPLKDRQLEIETWVDGGIVGKIPQDITGFADPKAITLKVTTARGQASDPSTSLTLKPVRVYMLVEPTVVTIAPGGPPNNCLYHSSGGYYVEHYNYTQHCRGIDIFCETIQLKNNWVVHEFGLKIHNCQGFTNRWFSMECTADEWAIPVQNYNLWVGKSTIPQYEISWGCGPNRAIVYSAYIYILGPRGTEYR